LLTERKQSKKATCFMIPTMWHSEKSKTTKASTKISGCQQLGIGWQPGEELNRLFLVLENHSVWYLSLMNSCHCTFVKPQWTVQ
jgi:hypothetical protein